MLRFDKTMGKTASVPPDSFLPSDTKNRFTDGSDGLRGHMLGNSTFVEVIASRWWYVFNGCEYGEEKCIPMLLRPLGWGCRLAFYLLSALFCVTAEMRSPSPIGFYTFSRKRDDEGVLTNDSSDFFEWYVSLVFVLWLVAIFTETMSYVVGRGGSAAPHDGQCSATPFLFFNRVTIGGGEDDCRCFKGVLILVWFLGFGVTASVMMHTIVAHLFVSRNTYFAWLFLMLLAFQLLAGLADVLSIGHIDGLQVQNRVASWLVSIRVVLILPVLAIVSVCFVFFCSPPWDSIF